MSDVKKPEADDYLDLDKVKTVEDFENVVEEVPAEEETAEPKSEIPDKYKGKTLEEVIKMNQDAQEYIAKQASTIGEVRGLADELIKRQLSTAVPDDTDDTVNNDEELNILLDPVGEVNRLINEHPTVKAAEQNNLSAAQERATRKLLSKHQDFAEVTASKGFQDWIAGSQVRLNSFKQAGQNFDADVGIELLDTYKALHPVQKQDDLNKGIDDAIRDGATPSGGGNSKPASNKGKLLKRSVLMKMMIEEPEKYDRLSPKINEAYANGWVVD